MQETAVINSFNSGAIMMGAFVAGLFFFKFWVKTEDRFFLAFSLSFWLMAIERWVLLVTTYKDETLPLIYLIRLMAFLLIIYAVVEKNRRQNSHLGE